MGSILQSVNKVNDIDTKIERLDRKNEEIQIQFDLKIKEKLDEPMKASTETVREIQKEISRMTRDITNINRNA